MIETQKQPVITCFIVSENSAINDHILQISNEFLNIKIIAICTNKEQQCAEIKQKMPDVIFWDKAAIYETSFDCLKKLPAVPQIVLLNRTDGITLDFPDYLVTAQIEHPFEQHKFTEVLNLVTDIKQEKERLSVEKTTPIQENNSVPDYIFVRLEGRVTRFDVHEILYFHGFGDYVMMKTTRGEFKLNTNMKKLGSKLEHRLFLKTHRAFVININKINYIEENEIIIGSERVLISRAHRPIVKEKLNII
jgi:two-component system LytT family response regulator